MPVVNMPDGTPVNFPDDMPSDQIRGMILQKFPNAERQARMSGYQDKIRARMSGLPDALKSKTAANIASEGMGALDPVLGANSLLDKGVYGLGQLVTSAGGLYPNKVSNWMGEAAHSGEKVSDSINANLQGLRAESGQSGFDPFRLAGNIASPVNAAFPAPTSLLDAAATGGAFGAIQPTSEGQSSLQPVANAAMGAGGGAAGYGLSKMLTGGAKALGIGVPQEDVPSVAALKSAAGDKYSQAENQGVIISKDSFQNMGQDLKAKLADEAIDPTNEPKAFAALNRVLGTDDNVTLKGVDKLRRGAMNAMDGATKSDKRLSRMIIDHIDDYVDNLQPQDLVGGVAKSRAAPFPPAADLAGGHDAMMNSLYSEAAQKADPGVGGPDLDAATSALSEARDLWKRGAKGETIDNLIAKAKTNSSMFGQSGMENSLRNQFRKLANNDRGMARFSPDEQDAIRKVAMGGPIENSLRYLGKLAPVGALPMAMELGGALANPAAAATTAVTGLAGRIGATAMTGRNARLASELMRRGAPAAEQAISPALQAITQQGTGTLGRIPPALLAQLLQGGAGTPAYGQAP